MSAREHFREAERLIDSADAWLDADHGWRAALSLQDRHAYRTSDLMAAASHGILAVAAALGADADPVEDATDRLVEDARRVPLLRVPMRSDHKTTPPAQDGATPKEGA